MEDKEGPGVAAVLAFAEALSDQEVVGLLQEHGVRGQAAFMWVAGQGGVHRLYEPLASALHASGGLAVDARRASAGHFDNGLDANTVRLRRFIEGHTVEDVDSNEALEGQLRSLLNIRYRLETALELVSAGAPIIYGIEISGTDDQVERARGDRRVFDSGKGERGQRLTPPRRPAAYDRSVEDARLADLTGRELYARAKEIVEAER